VADPSTIERVVLASGKVAFKGGTNSNATFATANLAPGDYVVQFKSKSESLQGNQYLVVVSAGRKKVIADAVSGNKFNGGGVAMRINVGRELRITGQVAVDQGVASAGTEKIRIINGNRYVWITARTGSNLGNHWEEEGLARSQVVLTISADRMRQIQDHAFEGSMLDRYHPSYAVDRDGY